MRGFKIEKGIPVPNRWGNAKSKYPWREMEVGDSFVVPNKGRFFGSATASQASKRYKPKLFRSFTEGQNVRIFRIE